MRPCSVDGNRFSFASVSKQRIHPYLNNIGVPELNGVNDYTIYNAKVCGQQFYLLVTFLRSVRFASRGAVRGGRLGESLREIVT